MSRIKLPAAGADRGSILVVVLVTILFTTLALTLFVEKAGEDLLVEAREADARRLRAEAYSSLETVLSVLTEFRAANGSLKSPSEGWDDPLAMAGYEPAEGRVVSVSFQDESGKLSLPHLTQATLVNMFKSWEITPTDAEKMADALLYWMKHDYVPSSGLTPYYELDSLTCEPPGRSLRSWGELASIDVIRDMFFEEDGRPNIFWKRFTESVSLLDFQSTNINAAGAGALETLGLDLNQQARLKDFLEGKGAFQAKGRGYLRSVSELAGIAGGTMPTGGVGTEISALRIIVTVRDGRALFRLNTVVALGGAAKVVTTKATPERPKKASSGSSTEQLKQSSGAKVSASGAASSSEAAEQSINYPFEILEIRENDASSTGPADPSASK